MFVYRSESFTRGLMLINLRCTSPLVPMTGVMHAEAGKQATEAGTLGPHISLHCHQLLRGVLETEIRSAQIICNVNITAH